MDDTEYLLMISRYKTIPFHTKTHQNTPNRTKLNQTIHYRDKPCITAPKPY